MVSAMTLPDQGTEFGQRVRRRLESELVMWFTTVGANGTPQPNPVWFVWEEPGSILVYNRTDARRLEHIADRPRVSLNFNATDHGGDIVVISGLAEQAPDVPPPDQHAEYLRKYGEAIVDVSGDAKRFAAEYSVPIRVHIEKVRGF